jgi:hypothetical protein
MPLRQHERQRLKSRRGGRRHDDDCDHSHGRGFTVDCFGVFLWRDTSATFATVIADVDFQSLHDVVGGGF